jgi:ribonuclease HI
VLLWEGGVYYPHATNNFVSTTDTPNERALMCFMAQAEYQGLLLGLRRALAFGITRLHVEGDSLLVVNQVNGSWQVSTTPTYL